MRRGHVPAPLQKWEGGFGSFLLKKKKATGMVFFGYLSFFQKKGMSTIKVFGLVCRYANYRENDRILTLFTREQGRLDVASRGCRRQGSPLLAASQPFVYGQFVLYQSKDKFSVNTADVLESFYPLRDDYDRFRAGLSMLALTVDSTRRGTPTPRCFPRCTTRCPICATPTTTPATCTSPIF